jgi:hypothetical protein
MIRHALMLFALFALTVAATVAAAQRRSAPAPQNGAILGTALDVNGGVVPGANVVLDGPAAADRQTTVTSENGFFEFKDLRAQTAYRVTVSAPYFASWTSQPIILARGQFFTIADIKLHLSVVQVTVTALTPEQIATEQVKAAEKQRIIGGVIPNFYVTYDEHPAPLTPKLKFQLAYRALIDPVTFAGFMLNAGIYQAIDYPQYSGGMKGYGQRLGATFAGGYTNIFVGDAILPSLLHQDPRYHFRGTGTTGSRLRYALLSPLITNGDNGRREINYSNIGGDLASGAIANAYYPDSERGVGLVFRSAAIGAGGRAANAVLQEFVFHRPRFRNKVEAASNTGSQ